MKRIYFSRLAWILTLLLLPSIGWADLPPGAWKISGTIEDARRTGRDGNTIIYRTNTLSLNGYYESGRFLMQVDPINVEHDRAERVGWDGDLLYMIHYFPSNFAKGAPLDQVLGFVEPDVFSRYASDALTGVMMAFATSNQLARLEKGEEIVILGKMRFYPEEDSTYTVRYGADGSVEIKSLCPALYQLPPVETTPPTGFEKGFKRWMYESNLRGIDEGKRTNEFLVDYKRMIISQGVEVIDRHVTAKILLQATEKIKTNFRPTISEDSLTVWDYGNRPELYTVSKGLADQNYTYVLTNHLWDFDRTLITRRFSEIKTRLQNGSLPKEKMRDALPDVRKPSVGRGNGRVLILSGLGAISVWFAGSLWLKSRQASQDKENKKEK